MAQRTCAARWALDPAVAFLNHGSFGACPRAVLRTQQGLRARTEAEPVRFLSRESPDFLDGARVAIASNRELALAARRTLAIEVPVMAWPAAPRRLPGISAQLYNTPAEYARLAEALVTQLGS